MKRLSTTLLLVLAVTLVAPAAAQDPADEGSWIYDDGLRYRAKDDAFALTIQGFVQARATAIDPELGETSESFDIPRAKLRFIADAFDHWELTLQANFAEGSENETNLLEDAFIRYKKHDLAQVWFGQGKVQFGRQALTPSRSLQFVDRSIASEEFLPTGDRNDNRDVGIALMGMNPARTYAYSVGVYNGNGINKDEKDNSDYMASARLVAMPFGELPLAETQVERPEGPRLAIGLSAVSLTRGTAALQEEIRDTTAALEFAFAAAGLNLNAEFFTRSGDQPLGQPGDEIDSDGWYFQGGYVFAKRFELALRYAEILRDTDNTDENEKGVAFNYYARGHGMKVQLDYRQLEFEAPPASPDIDRDVFRFQMQFGF